MKQSGITVDNKMVMSGCFEYVATHGIPLELVLEHAKDNAYVVDWPDYIQCALADGHNPSTIVSRIRAACGDVYGKEYADEVCARVNAIPASIWRGRLYG